MITKRSALVCAITLQALLTCDLPGANAADLEEARIYKEQREREAIEGLADVPAAEVPAEFAEARSDWVLEQKRTEDGGRPAESNWVQPFHRPAPPPETGFAGSWVPDRQGLPSPAVERDAVATTALVGMTETEKEGDRDGNGLLLGAIAVGVSLVAFGWWHQRPKRRRTEPVRDQNSRFKWSD